MNNEKNIILITIDCLRADHMSGMGYSRLTSPNMDKMADNGLLFTNTTAVSSVTKKSFPGILSSRYPSMCANLDNPFEYHPSIAQILKKQGYCTAAFHSNIVISRRFGYDVGFDTFEDNLRVRGINTGKIFSNALRLFRKINNKLNVILRGGKNPKVSGEQLTASAITWIKNQQSKFFVWIHYLDVHGPYIPAKKYLSFFKNEKITFREAFRLWNKAVRSFKNPGNLTEKELQNIIDLYDANIRYVDECVNDFMQNLKKMNKFENTVIIITADHGEEFAEHGNLSHHRKLYDELIHIPLIIYNLKGFESKVIDAPVSLIDLAPTIADLAGISEVKSFKGKSILPYLSKPDKHLKGTISEADAFFKGKLVTEGTRVIAYRTRDWKLIQIDEPFTRELYNLKKDPFEKNNIYEMHTELAKEFQKHIDAHKNEVELEKLQKERKAIDNIVNTIKFR